VNCDEVRAALLAGDRNPAVEAHRRTCVACRRAEPGLEVLRRHLDDPDVWVEPSFDLEDRVAAAVRTAATGAAGLPIPGARDRTGAGRDHPSERTHPRSRSRERARRRRWSLANGWVVAGMGAAVAAVVALIAILVSGSSGPHPDFEVALIGTRNAPAATAHVYGWNDAAGTRLKIDIDGLPPSGPDAYYTIWMTSPDGRHVPAGTFRSSGVVWGWAGVTEAEFPRIWVTLEPNDHDESLSGPAVLDNQQPVS
jgi:hypothetical protein